jgi:hypothetical protein
MEFIEKKSMLLALKYTIDYGIGEIKSIAALKIIASIGIKNKILITVLLLII